MNGSVLERTFNPSEKLQRANVETKEMQYLYSDGEMYHFMDTKSYEQMPLSGDQVGDAMKYVKENMSVTIKFFKGAPFSVEPPNFVELKIIKTDPGARGDTVTGASKPATLETGAIVSVPLFINEGEVIRVDTRSDEYMERA